MFCKKCGQKLNDGSKFCPYCGATQSAPEAPAAAPAAPVSSPIPEPAAAPAPAPAPAPAAPAPAPVQPVIPAPAPAAPAPVQPSVPASKQGGSKGLIAGISIGVAVLVVLVALLVISLLGSPKSSVIKAIEKSSDEFSSVSELFGASVIKNASEKKSFTQDFELKIKSLGDNSYYDVSVMEGLGFRTSVGIDVEKQKMSGDIAAVYGSADLISGYLNVDKTAVSVYSPEFFGDDAIGLDTATLGKKLAEKTGDDSMADISFNIFDLVEALPTSGEVDQEAVKVLVDAIEVEKEGKKEVEVNGADLKCTGYHVVVPEDAMVDYLDAAREQMESSAFIDNAEALYGSMGLPKDEIDTVISEMTEAMNLQYDAFEEIINEIGDLEFDVYLNKGLVADVIWEVEIDGEKAEIELQLGGEKEYINNVGLFITVNGETLAIESEGNHVPDGGVFTDTTLLSMKGNPLTIKIKTEYNTKETEDNLSISMKVAGQELMGVNGSLAVAKDSIALTFDELFITDGYQTYSMEGSYGFGPYKDVESPAKDTQNILDMSDEDLAKWAEEVEQNAGNLLSDLYVEYPDLANMLFS